MPEGKTGDTVKVWCRAFTEDGTSQPFRSPARGGYLYNGYHEAGIVLQ